jgi:dTDP-4-amino-4,6-dideoxygalactose transaminase
MIRLFNVPSHKIDTAKFSNLLHDSIVSEFENNLANYVGASYCVTFNSATSAIFLLMSWLKRYVDRYSYNLMIPSVIPPVVPNAIINAGVEFKFIDNPGWVGYAYKMNEEPILGYMNIIDSAHKIYHNQYKIEGGGGAVIIYSFYPTKPISGCDGGAMVSDNEDFINQMRLLSKNGLHNKYPIEVGHKMYMNSIQAYIANENLKTLGCKKRRLDEIRKAYNSGIKNVMVASSDHLFVISIDNEEQRNLFMLNKDIEFGFHYPALHNHKLYSEYKYDDNYELSVIWNNTCVSIPFHEALTDEEIETVIKFVNQNAE